MLVICLNNGEDRVWHIGEQDPIAKYMDELYDGASMSEKEQGIMLRVTLDKVYMVQADGDELDHISRMYPDKGASVPLPNKRVARWCGDIARTILLNL